MDTIDYQANLYKELLEQICPEEAGLVYGIVRTN